MLFKKSFSELVSESLKDLQENTDITNISVGGITRSLIEVINHKLAEYYDVLEINQDMCFLSTAEGYFLDLIGDLFNMSRLVANTATQTSVDEVQRFYVTSGTLTALIPGGQIVSGTTVSTSDGNITFTVSTTTSFSAGATEVFVPITASIEGTSQNVGKNALIVSSLDVANVYTVNNKPIISGSDTESDDNYRYRLANATLSAEKANKIAIRLAALGVDGVADVVMHPFSRGIGTYDVMVIPIEGLANDSLIASVQEAIDEVQAFGIKGTAVSPTVVPVDIEVRLVFVPDTTDANKGDIRALVETSIEQYIVNIIIGGTFVYNELVQQVMDVSPLIKDMRVHCYYFREKPHMLDNVEIYHDEIFYPNTNSTKAIRAV